MNTTSASRRRVGDRERNAVFDKSRDVLVWLGRQFEADGNNLLGGVVRCFSEGLMGAEADVVCGADYGRISPQPWLLSSARRGRSDSGDKFGCLGVSEAARAF